MQEMLGCETVSRKFVHLVIPKFISPNNDGYNDYFEIPGISFFGPSEIRIFDRFGKLLKWGTGSNLKWNGSIVGKFFLQKITGTKSSLKDWRLSKAVLAY